MSRKEIRELLLLKEWSRAQLGVKLNLKPNTIDKWFCTEERHQRHPSPEHVQMMRTWLAEAREEARSQPA